VTLLIVGLILFLGTHSARIFAEDSRNALIARLGLMPWKGIYSLLSLAGLLLIVYGYGEARATPISLWPVSTGGRHAASLLTLFSFIALAAAYVPRNRIKARLRHPMVLAVKTWALAHLLANGTLADLLLFGGFLVWAVLSFRAARARDRAAALMNADTDSGSASASAPAGGSLAFDLATIAVGLIAWGAFAFHLHARWIGVSPMG
jgi:uncharacterized membrane protein